MSDSLMNRVRKGGLHAHAAEVLAALQSWETIRQQRDDALARANAAEVAAARRAARPAEPKPYLCGDCRHADSYGIALRKGCDLDCHYESIHKAPAQKLPPGWVPLTLEWEPGYPEDVAFGPQRLMDRLKKWLDAHFARRVAAAQPAGEKVVVAEVGDLVIDVRERVMKRGFKNRDALYVIPPAAARPAEPVAMAKETLVEIIAGGLKDTYHCTRVWSAWGVGTMSEDDFEPVYESDTPAEIADAILSAFAASPAAARAPLTLTDEQVERAVDVWFNSEVAHAAEDDLDARFRNRMRAAIEAAGQEGGAA